MTIKKKLIALMGLVFVLTFGIFLFESYIIKQVEYVEEQRLLIGQLNVDMLTLRRNEKDFLARNNLKYLAKFEKNYNKTLADISLLRAAMEENGVDASKVDTYASIMKNYQQTFVSLVNVQKEIGLNPKDGLYGALRTAVHNAETAIKEQKDYKLLSDMLMLRRREKDFMLRNDEKYIAKFNKDFTKLEGHLNESGMSSAAKDVISAFMQTYKKDFLALTDGYKIKGLNSKSGLQGEMRNTVHKTETVLKELSEEVKAASEAHISFYETLSLIISLALSLILVGIVFLISRSIIQPVEKLQRAMNIACENKDLSVTVDIPGQDEIASVANVYNTMINEFNNLINHVKESASQLTHSASELSAITEQTSYGVQQQQQESDQVATAINEMSASVQEVARSAEAAADASQHADNESQKGRGIVQEASNGIMDLAHEVENTARVIKELEQESINIGTVVNVIDEIAEQTNLLALNAAIEAARAGESGRGFAVVADEVRTLAQRSQKSTKEIKEIIERLQASTSKAVVAMDAGQEKAQHTVEKAQATDVSLNAITSAISTIREMNIQIAAASEEQAAVAEEVNKSIIRITEVAGETSQGAGQTTATSNDLSALAVELQRVISQFKTV